MKNNFKNDFQKFPLCSKFADHFTGVKLIKEVGRLLKQSPLWRILAIMFRDAGRDMIQAYYLDDFVKMVHHPKSKLPGAEYEVIIV